MGRNKVRTKVPGGSKEVVVAPLGKRMQNARERNTGNRAATGGAHSGGVPKVKPFPKTTSLGANSGVAGTLVGDKNKKKKVLTEKDLVWDSGLKIVNPPILIDVPPSLALVMKAIDEKIVGSVEFSIYVKADISDIECIRISEAYCIPRQVVSSGSVDYNDVPPDGFNAVIHKHPRGIKSFSGTDDQYINQNFTVSILWCAGEFVDAIVNYDISPGVKLQLEGFVYVDDTSNLPEVDVDNISVMKQTVVKHVPLGANARRGCHVPGTEQSAMDVYAEQYGYFRDEESSFMDPEEGEDFSLVGRGSLSVGL